MTYEGATAVFFRTVIGTNTPGAVDVCLYQAVGEAASPRRLSRLTRIPHQPQCAPRTAAYHPASVGGAVNGLQNKTSPRPKVIYQIRDDILKTDKNLIPCTLKVVQCYGEPTVFYFALETKA